MTSSLVNVHGKSMLIFVLFTNSKILIVRALYSMTVDILTIGNNTYKKIDMTVSDF